MSDATAQRMFRNAALERLNSPQQLDQRIGLIPPAMRLLAASMAVIIVADWGAACSEASRTRSGAGSACCLPTGRATSPSRRFHRASCSRCS